MTSDDEMLDKLLAIHSQQRQQKEDAAPTLNDQQQEILTRITANPHTNFFITGSAGTGKTVLLQALTAHFNNPRKLAVVAPTGVASVNCGGVTIHSRFKIDPYTDVDIALGGAVPPILLFSTLVIEEISMVSKKLFITMDRALKQHNKNDLPFGGVQVIIFGDFFQLTPVITNESRVFTCDGIKQLDDFCFTASEWTDLELEPFVLDKVLRQNDTEFIGLLQRMRRAQTTVADCRSLVRRVMPCSFEDYDWPHNVVPTFLFGTNKQVEAMNSSQFQRLDAPAVQVRGTFTWYKNATTVVSHVTPEMKRFESQLCDSVGVKAAFELKRGAQVMLRYNMSVESGLCNGTRGVVTRVENKGKPAVSMARHDGKECTVTPVVFKRKFNGLTVHFTVLPLCLAWAMTVHKSQGLSIDMVGLDLSAESIFLPHQGYVALSRARSLEGVYLKNFDRHSIYLDERVVKFYRSLTAEDEEAAPPEEDASAAYDFDDFLTHACLSAFDASFARAPNHSRQTVLTYNGAECALAGYRLPDTRSFFGLLMSEAAPWPETSQSFDARVHDRLDLCESFKTLYTLRLSWTADVKSIDLVRKKVAETKKFKGETAPTILVHIPAGCKAVVVSGMFIVNYELVFNSSDSVVTVSVSFK